MKGSNWQNNADHGDIDLSTLPRVEAPDNFESMVRTRIAATRPSDDLSAPVFWLALKFAVPMLLIMVVGVGFFLMRGGQSEIAVVDVMPPAAPEQKALSAPEQQDDQPSSPESAVAVQSDPRPVKPALKDPRNPRPAADGNDPAGGSQDMALGQDTPTYSSDFDPNRRSVTPSAPGSGNGISVEAILGMLGIKPECKANGCLAVSLTKQGMAERAGVKGGDLIEAIDDKPVKAGTTFEGAINVTSLRVLRAGKRLTISLKS